MLNSPIVFSATCSQGGLNHLLDPGFFWQTVSNTFVTCVETTGILQWVETDLNRMNDMFKERVEQLSQPLQYKSTPPPTHTLFQLLKDFYTVFKVLWGYLRNPSAVSLLCISTIWSVFLVRVMCVFFTLFIISRHNLHSTPLLLCVCCSTLL